MKKRNIFNDKSGLSHHIEMTFAFVIFIAFVFFVLIFVKPYDNNYLTDSVVDGAKYNFFENVKVNLVTFFIMVNNSDGSGNCFRFDLPNGLVDDSVNSSFVRIVNSGEVDSHFLEGSDELRISGVENNSYYVFLSNEFNDSPLLGCSENNNWDYKFGSFMEEEVISIDKLNQMKNEYENDYEALKKKLAIPSVFDFAIVSSDFSMEKGSFSYEVLARDYVYKVLFNDGSIKSMRFTIKLWR